MSNDSENESKRAQQLGERVAEYRKILRKLRDDSLHPLQGIFVLHNFLSPPKTNGNTENSDNIVKYVRELVAELSIHFAFEQFDEMSSQEFVNNYDRIFEHLSDNVLLSARISKAMAGAYFFGAITFMNYQNSPDRKAEFLQEFQKIQASIMRDAISRQTAVKREKLRAAITAEVIAKNKTLAASKEFASFIRPGVMTRLGLKPDAVGYPSVASIKGEISRLKKSAKT